MTPDPDPSGTTFAAAQPRRACLTDHVSVESLVRMQEQFAALGHVTIVTCDADGQPIVPPRWGSEYAAMLGTSEHGGARLAESLREVAHAAGAGVPSMCFRGTALYAAAIRVRGGTLGYIVVGTRPPHALDDAEVRAIAAEYGIDAARLLPAAADVAPWNEELQQATYRFADLFAETLAALYGQAREIEHNLADLGAVHGLAGMLAGTRDLQEILNVTTRRVVEVLEVKACAIRLLNEETGELVLKAVCNLSPEYLGKGPIMLGEAAIDTAAYNGETVYIEDAPNDPRTRYPENARREGLVSGLSVPMTYRGRTIGVIRVYTGYKYRFTDAEALLLRSIGSLAAAAIIHTRLYEEHVQSERLRQQIHYAGEIQRRMLPAGPPRHPTLQFGCVYAPTLEVGGDFYDFIELPGGNLGLCIADVVGKGLPAALLMASIRSALRAYAFGIYDLDKIIAQVNAAMSRDTLPSEFATLVYGVFSPDGRTFTYCNAGHPPPLLIRGGRMIELTRGGTVIGIDAGAAFEREALSLHASDTLVLFTDGVTDARNFRREPYGFERLRASITQHLRLDAAQMASQLAWDVRRFAGLAEQTDDTTIVVVKVG